MSKYEKTRAKILGGTADRNIDFSAMCQLLVRLGFDERIRGSHHIFTREDVEEIINLQPDGSSSKAYQVRQVRDILLKYRLGDVDVD
jgi:hypothetical protein